MTMYIKTYLTIIIFSCACSASAQRGVDTTELLKEFTKVMSFTSQPYLHYKAITKMNAVPILEATDTLTLFGEFYKDNINFYSNNVKEEIYLHDSMMVEINNDRKTIWLRKADMIGREKMNLLPTNLTGMLERFKNHYIVSKSKVGEDICRLKFAERKPVYSSSATQTLISIDYSEKTFLPKLIEVTISMKQPVNEEILAAVEQESFDKSKLIQRIDGIDYVMRKQIMSISFIEMDNEKEKILKMPVYMSAIQLTESGEYIAKGLYEDYEITKTF